MNIEDCTHPDCLVVVNPPYPWVCDHDETVWHRTNVNHPDVPHHYTSTACHHSRHNYCQSTTGQAGPKTPATCKWCPAKCECACHGR